MVYNIFVPYPNTIAWQVIPRGSAVVETEFPTEDPQYVDIRFAAPPRGGQNRYIERIAQAAQITAVTKPEGGLIPIGALHLIGTFDSDTKQISLALGGEACLEYWIQSFGLPDKELQL